MGLSKKLDDLKLMLRSQLPNYNIELVDDYTTHTPLDKSIYISLLNELHKDKKRSVILKFYFYNKKSLSIDFLNFKNNIDTFVGLLKDFEDLTFFSEERDINLGDINFKKSTLINEFRIATITSSYDISKLLDIDYSEGEKDIMENLFTKL